MIEITVNGEPVSTIVAIRNVLLIVLPWLYGWWALTGKLSDWLAPKIHSKLWKHWR